MDCWSDEKSIAVHLMALVRWEEKASSQILTRIEGLRKSLYETEKLVEETNEALLKMNGEFSNFATVWMSFLEFIVQQNKKKYSDYTQKLEAWNENRMTLNHTSNPILICKEY